MPPSRLQPLPFVEPARLIAYLEQDPSLLEAGLTLLARRLPVPAAGPGLVIDLLALDGAGALTAIDVSELATGRTLEKCLAIRSWLQSNLSTLRSLVPGLAAAGREIRSVLISGHFAPAARSILLQISSQRPETLEVQIFEGPSGPALCFQTLPGLQPAGDAPLFESGPALEAVASPAPSDPLAGIPLSAEEAEEFRSLDAPPASHAANLDRGIATRPAPPQRGSFLEN